MKRILSAIAGILLVMPVAQAGEEAPAILGRKDGRELRVFLQKFDPAALIVRLDNAAADSRIGMEDVVWLQFNCPEFDENKVQQQFNNAGYKEVIATLEPCTAPYRGYVSITNNLETMFCLLMNAYLEVGDYAQARDLSTRLMANKNPDVLASAQVGRILAAIGEKDVKTAEGIMEKIQDPAAKLYAQACVARAKNQPKVAIQSAVKLIAEYSNNMDWMPQTELLCAELYNEMGMTNSAVATARQVQKFYAGMNVEKEAQALRSKIERSTEKSK